MENSADPDQIASHEGMPYFPEKMTKRPYSSHDSAFFGTNISLKIRFCTYHIWKQQKFRRAYLNAVSPWPLLLIHI